MSKPSHAFLHRYLYFGQFLDVVCKTGKHLSQICICSFDYIHPAWEGKRYCAVCVIHVQLQIMRRDPNMIIGKRS